MRSLIALVLFASGAWAQTPPSAIDVRACSQLRTAAACNVSKSDLKRAQENFRQALDLQKAGKTQQAFDAADAASRLVPDDIEYLTTREILRQKLVLSHLDAGNSLLLEHNSERATAEFRQALALDPSNEFARQRLGDALPPAVASPSRLAFTDSPGELRVAPTAGVHSYHYRGDTKGLFQQIARDFGLGVEFDESVVSRPTRFDLDEVSFSRVMELACQLTKTFWTPLSPKRFLLVADNRQNRAQLERMSSRTFYLTDATSAQELSDMMNVLRMLFDIRQITQQAEDSSIVVRAPRYLLDAATELLRTIDLSRPQVMLEFQVLQVNRSMMKDMGLDIPLQWQAFNLSAAALAALQQPNVQDLINQLIASGGINQANSSSIAALLQQVQSQQNSLFKNPFATFGGGSTLFAIPVIPSAAHFSMNSSRVTTVQSLTLRASQGNEATLRIGDRYPIINATFAPIYNTSAISQVLQNQTYQNPFPSFSFEDLGLTVKAKPQIHQTEVTLDVTMEMKALTGASFNGVPVISSRSYTGSLAVKDGETAIIAGSIDHSESGSMTGLPGLAAIPILSRATTHYTPQSSDGELLVMITPRIVRRSSSSSPTIMVRSVE